jgi:hypothetical protein
MVEYKVVAHTVAETCWLRQVLQELHTPLPLAKIVYCDNVSVVYMTRILFIISARNILRLTFTLSVTRLL